MRRGLGFHARRSPGVFNPASLFLGGTVNGAWYDPSDATTLFSDRAGTTPCGTPGGGSVVPVGLMLDKSQGLVLGSETVTNGDFSGGTTTGWTPQSAALSVVGGQLSVVPSTTFGYAYQTLTTVVGTTYKITFDYNQSTAAIARYFVGTAVGGDQLIALTTVSGVGSVSRYFTATTTTTFIHFGAQNSSGLQALFDNISVRAIAGNHAIAANDTTARPELRARVNLLTYSEQFDNAAWAKFGLNAFGSGSVANTTATLDPFGGNTADYIQENTASASHLVLQAASVGANVQAVFSVYMKAAERTWGVIYPETSGGAGAGVWFNLATGVVGTQGAGRVGSITSVGNGWYRCSVVATLSTDSQRFYFGPASADNTISYTGNGTSGIYVWGADLRPTNIGTAMPAYQRISDANTYDAVGFPRYLACNGTSSAMSTPGNVNLSGTDKATVFAGVRKLSDAALGILAELSAIANSNNGSFAVAAPGWSPVASRYGALFRATVNFETSDSPASFSSPISNVLSYAFDTSNVVQVNRTKLRVNAADQTLSYGFGPTTPGGNFGSYPLYIGARNTSGFFFNGNIYSLIVVGSAVSAGQISATEQWVAGKTGITI